MAEILVTENITGEAMTRLRETLAAERAVAEGEASALKGKIDAVVAQSSTKDVLPFMRAAALPEEADDSAGPLH